MVIFACIGMYPFGNRQIMIIDSWHQYYPIFQELNYRLTSSESLLYSWNSGLGTNFVTMAGYYAMSPLYLLSILCPKEYLREFFWIITVFKIALGGACFSYYIQSIYKKKDLSITLFGIIYSFSGFFMGYYWNIMWLDAVALLPLIILGLHQLMDNKSHYLYLITLALSLISNFYIGYFICEFIAIYSFILYFRNYQKKSFKHFIKKILTIVSCSLASIGLSAGFLLPIFFGMTHAYGHSSSNPTSFETYHSILDILNNLFIKVTPTIMDGLPNINSGIFVLLLCLIYFSLPIITKRQKFISGGLLLFLFLSMNINYLNFIWHGFHFPNQVPYRFSFLVSFVLISLAYESYVNIHSLHPKTLGILLGMIAVYLLLNEKFNSEILSSITIYLSGLFFLSYGLILYGHIINRIDTKSLWVFLFIIIISESFVHAQTAVIAADSSLRDDYYFLGKEIQTSLEAIRNMDNSLYRLELTPEYGTNDALVYRYRGVSQFSSTTNAALSNFTQKMGMPSDPRSNTISYKPSTPALNGMFDVKYILSKNDTLPTPNASYKSIHQEENLITYQNIFSLPLGYYVSTDIQKLDLYAVSPFIKQESFYEYATGQVAQLFTPYVPSTENYTNMEVTNVEDSRFHYKNLDATQKGSAIINYTIKPGGQTYLYMLNQTPTMSLKINNTTKEHKTPRGIIVDLGMLEPNTQIEVTFEVYAAATGYFDLEIVSFDSETFTAVRETLLMHPLEILDYTDTSINALINAPDQGLIYTSIPYEKGWHLRVDDKKIKPLAYKDAVLAIPITSGKHHISLHYRPYGILGGWMISLLTLLLLITLNFFIRHTDIKYEETLVNSNNTN